MIAETVPLGELTKVQTGKLDANASSDDGEYPFFTCAREPLRIDRWKYDLDAVLVAGNGDLNVKHYKGKFESYQRTYIINSLNDQRLNTRYLFHFLDKYVEKLREQSIGGIIKYIKLDMLTGAEIPLPPLEEQRRIAAILDQADTLRRLRRRALDRLNTLGQAVFIDLFGNRDFPLKPLKTVGNVSTGSTPSTNIPEYFGDDVPFVTPGDLMDTSNPKRYLTELGAKKSRVVGSGALFVCCIGSVGKMGIATTKSAFNQQINAVSWGDKILSTYVYYAMFQRISVIEYWAARAATTLPILKKSEFEKLEIPVPDLTIQKAFCKKIQEIARPRETLLQSGSNIEQLFLSLQHRAFQGDI